MGWYVTSGTRVKEPGSQRIGILIVAGIGRFVGRRGNRIMDDDGCIFLVMEAHVVKYQDFMGELNINHGSRDEEMSEGGKDPIMLGIVPTLGTRE